MIPSSTETNVAYKFIAPHAPTRRLLPGKEFNPREITNEGNDPIAHLIGLSGVLPARRDNEVWNASAYALWVTSSRQQADLRVRAGPKTQTEMKAVAGGILLHPRERHCLISKPPRLDHA